MKTQSYAKRLLGTTSPLALATAAFLASSGTPASAQAIYGLYFGGSTLASQVFRQIFNCYTGATIGNDGFTFSSSFNSAAPTPSLLPTTCTVTRGTTVQGMYAGVGSGNGMRGYISNRPDQWYSGRFAVLTTNVTIGTPFPAVQPPFVDSGNPANFGTYPYPRVDIALSEAPLTIVWPSTTLTTVSNSFTPATSWATGGVTTSTTQVMLNSTTAVAAYNTAAYGVPIQVPAMEINLAIPVNVSTFTPNSQIKDASGNIVTGGAIQLSSAQICAIFSGKVTNWNSTANIPFMNSAGVRYTKPFYYANVGDGIGTASQYTTANLPITVVFRSDEDGTSFILTNYLKAVCPQIDASYDAIFNTANLPSSNFGNVIANINDMSITGSWVRVIGDGGVAATIGTGSAHAGYIGYAGANFTKPYAQTVSGAGLTNVQAPYSASLQNENQRFAGIEIPTTTTTTSPTFIAPTPAGAGLAWGDFRLQTPSSTWTWNDYNIYNNVFSAGEPNQGGVNVVGKSVLPLTNVAGAYPLSGATFLDLYSCYSVAADANRVNNLRPFLYWYFQNADSNPQATAVTINNGFTPLPDTYKAVIRFKYFSPVQPTRITAAPASGTGFGGCTGVTGGAL